MATGPVTVTARREAVQPSLWDRLVDDLPGLTSETEMRRRDLGAALGEDRLAQLVQGGVRAVEQAQDLPEAQRREIVAFIASLQRRAFLEERGIVVTPDVLREAVRRDLEELFGIERLQARFLWTETERGNSEDLQDVLADYPHVCRSVLNYGVPSFSGRRAMDFDPEILARELREVVATFEPRLKRDSIRVTVDTGNRDGLKVKIDGVLMLSPVPERLRLSTTINLDNGSAATRIEEG
ncbi:GPW/gp25 family protein [Xinfangfangia sp. CPCC 101601]|uniref:GPW/gp25 family protein n=1 Tax=Pseudogemmobacter lacusdianii TaxID=3069608 RepID=A0ABU0VVB8_9RHOB|nr:GPW/gp25 family protein [Xinfangfangia sp. CPCC 101601]MDQ2065692.1 GPW/gp25 family protein [Xinfangfangia sp. CPCC 101601]